MLKNLKDTEGFKIHAQDGEIGKVKDFLFDDHSWTIRYMVVNTGSWRFGQSVLVATDAFSKVEWDQKRFDVSITRKMIEDSPHLDEHIPISRKHEELLRTHFSWPIYWSNEAAPITLPFNPEETRHKPSYDANLESVNDIERFSIHATDGKIGKIEGFIVDEKWVIRYFVIDSSNWLTGRKVIVSPEWINSFDNDQGIILINHTKQEIKESPEYDDKYPLEREHENELYEHYKRNKYWGT